MGIKAKTIVTLDVSDPLNVTIDVLVWVLKQTPIVTCEILEEKRML